jgi:excisionase family DNA binding protein
MKVQKRKPSHMPQEVSMANPAVLDRQMMPLLLTMKHVQDVTGLSKAKAYELAHSRGFPLVRFGRSMRVPREAFLRWLDQQAGAQE